MFQRGQGDAERLCLEEANALLGGLRPSAVTLTAWASSRHGFLSLVCYSCTLAAKKVAVGALAVVHRGGTGDRWVGPSHCLRQHLVKETAQCVLHRTGQRYFIMFQDCGPFLCY